ncbi:VanW family protein [Candidatus Gracilibacteria bacterium]|nr:VanW family protein [Candidatus Gracilibacteria bacterium]
MKIHKRKIFSIIIGVSIGLLLGSIFAFAKTKLDGKITPGSEVAGIDLSYLDSQQAEELLKEKVDTFAKARIKFTLNEEPKYLSLEELGIELLPEQTIANIEFTDTNPFASAFHIVIPVAKQLELQHNIDEEKLWKALDEQFALTEKEPIESTATFERDKLIITESRNGQFLEKELLLKAIQASINNLEKEELALIMTGAEPRTKKEDLEPQRELIKTGLRHRFTLIDPVYSDNWTTSLAEHLDWVEFEIQTDGIVAIKIKQNKLNEYLDTEISKWLDLEVEQVTMTLGQEGKVDIEGHGNNGLKIEREQLRGEIELAISVLEKDIEIPVSEIEPELFIAPELQKLGIVERISIGHTSFYGSPVNRIHNIKVGAERFNGHLVAPGETFSFNTTLGPVEAYTGYRKELVIKPEGTIPEYGGGICQVSTTLYRSILESGLKISERNQHSYAVSYYAQIQGHGLDATIYLGGPDLKFENTTDSHILIQTFTRADDRELYVIFYGTSPGKTVELEGPFLSNYRQPGETIYEDSNEIAPGTTKQVEKNHTGFDVTWYRHITDRDGNVDTEEINTRYKAVSAKILVGTTPSSPVQAP